MRRIIVGAFLAAFAVGCGAEGDAETSDDFEAHLTAASCAVLKLANTATFDELDIDARLDSRAAKAIFAARQGQDGVEGTVDDGWFTTISELYALPYVGKSAMGKLYKHAQSTNVACSTVGVQLLAFNDYHGAMEPPQGSGGKVATSLDPNAPAVLAGGAEFLATHIKARREQNPNTLVVAAGDVIGATPLLSSAFHDEPTIESVSRMGLDVASVGNHEFDEGFEELLRMQGGGCHPVDGCQDGDGFDGAAFQYLAANVERNDTRTTVFPPYIVRKFGNARVGIVGMTLEGTPDVVTEFGVHDLTFHDEADTVNALVPELRGRGVNTIVVLLHEGGASTGLYNQCDGISGPLFEVVARLDPAIAVVIAGHTNAAHVCDIDGRLVTSAAHNGRLLTDIDLQIDEMTGEITEMAADNVVVTREVTKDADQTDLIAKYGALVAPIANRGVGSIAGDLSKVATPSGEFPMGLVIADAQLAASDGPEEGAAVIAFMNPGGVRAELLVNQISGGELPGAVTYGELFAVQPFANNLTTLDVTGAQIEQMLEQQWLTEGKDRSAKPMILLPSSGFHYVWNPAGPPGDKVDPSTITLGGAVLDPATTYRIAVNAFLAAGGDGFTVLKLGTNRKSGVVDLDALQSYFADHVPVEVPAPGRIALP